MTARTITAKTVDDGRQELMVSDGALNHRVSLSLLDGPTFGVIRVYGRPTTRDEFALLTKLQPGGSNETELFGIFGEFAFEPEDVDPGKRYSLIVNSGNPVGVFSLEQTVEASGVDVIGAPFGDGDVWVFISAPAAAVGRVRIGCGYDEVDAKSFVADLAFRRSGFIRQRGNRLIIDNASGQSVKVSAFFIDVPAPVILGINYIPVTSSSYTVEVGQLMPGRNVVGVQQTGAVSITIPRSMPAGYLLTVKDEAGGGNITITPQ